MTDTYVSTAPAGFGGTGSVGVPAVPATGLPAVPTLTWAAMPGTGVPCVRLLAGGAGATGGALPIDGRIRFTAPALAVATPADSRHSTGDTTVLNVPNGTTLGNHSPGRPQS